jgi:hypothetical protein
VASKFCNCDVVILDNVALLLSLVATSEFYTLTSTVRFALAVMLASDLKNILLLSMSKLSTLLILFRRAYYLWLLSHLSATSVNFE